MAASSPVTVKLPSVMPALSVKLSFDGQNATCPYIVLDDGFPDVLNAGRVNGRDISMILIGYARVSTGGQDLALQLDALRAMGCSKIFEEHASGAKAERPELAKTLAHLRAGDTLVVWKLDRLGRDLRHLVNVVHELTDRGIGLKVLTGQGAQIDTTTAQGKLVFGIFAALAEFERDLIRERTQAGLMAAAARGRKGGRKPVVTPDKLKRARAMVKQGLNVREAAMRLKIGKTALYSALADAAAASQREVTRPRTRK
jgi:DNA invertase Pin-like site-specific DNA recombinase